MKTKSKVAINKNTSKMDQDSEVETLKNDRATSLTTFQEYFYANLLFWGFLILLAIVSFFTCGGIWDSVTAEMMKFIFLVFGGGFTLVSVMDYLYEKYVVEPNKNKHD
jgi:hypothetical protein